jgi:hypothetical protein
MLSKRHSKPGPQEDAAPSKPTSPGSSQLAQRQPTPQTLFDQILAMLDGSAKAQLLHALQVYKVDPNDGYMVILLSHATIAQALLDAPDRIKEGIDVIFRQHLAAIDRYLQEVKTTAKQEMETAIAQGVARTSKSYIEAQEMSGLAPLAVPILAVCSVLLVAMGAVGGWAFSQRQRSPIAAGNVSLTEEQAANFRWLETDEGQLAKDIVLWNDGQIVACQKKQVELFKEGQVVIPGYGKVTSGACVLWVVPPGARTFKP